MGLKLLQCMVLVIRWCFVKNKIRNFGLSLIGFFLFFLTVAMTSTASVVVYSLVNRNTNGNIVALIFSVLGTIIAGAILCWAIDIVRRKIMVEKPTKKILEATEKIASGDFSVKLEHMHDYGKYDEYDLIFDNINIMTAELSKNEVLKTDFIANVSHEIKTPLAVIQGYAKALQNEKLDAKKRQESLAGLEIQTKKLSDLISNILKLNKLENQKTVPEMENIDLAELLRLCALSFENLFEKKNIELECDIDEVKIVGSASLLEMVFNNLISNAIKFTDEGGKISISLKQEKKNVIVKVKDTGCGISQEVGSRIFDKFYQADTSHSSEGNGLGLALVKKVIDVIGGEISVESKVGEGSSFIIKLKKENA